MSRKIADTFIVAAKRTPFGAFGGKLKDVSATELGAHASTAALDTLPESARKAVSSTIFGNVMHTSKDAAYLARHVGLRAGLAQETPALTINRLCGSGFQAVINAVHEISLGDSDIVLTGGTESMSQAPYILRSGRWGTRYGVDQTLEDSLAHSLVDQYPGTSTPCPMGNTAEKLGAQYGITRGDCDAFALLSQQRASKGQESGAFTEEIAPMQVKGKKRGETETLGLDEHPRPSTKLENLTKLSPVFKKGDGLVTAGNASGICDGAAAVVVASADAVSSHSINPLARVVSYGVVGVDPSIMGIGPVPAIHMALKRAGLTLDQMDLIEVNEAFAAQFLSVQKELSLESERTNVNGGAIAIGHPLAASGSRILAHLAHTLRATGKRYGLGSACIGGGQGIAVIIENVEA
ncbi:Thiolase, N-terminal domain-containing protein [Piptocephalis cylindrospora]|uniref:Thiolase, N-terminal domain-containing protein n=1 Tax=Piptocephalis cylindrospora TaxID=1907219 RepID=A0A4P9Y0Z0_9FUNG|nr:Thiolase, N-terminal domain-containing protein [Piptocephalis cylindrospora]|eukprot:RKP12418.1 Thiolase, N-terminal domain-containing protein [Piptocephalis cylindrospora]